MTALQCRYATSIQTPEGSLAKTSLVLCHPDFMNTPEGKQLLGDAQHALRSAQEVGLFYSDANINIEGNACNITIPVDNYGDAKLIAQDLPGKVCTLTGATQLNGILLHKGSSRTK